MKKYLSTLVLMLICIEGFSQDTLWIKAIDAKPFIRHRVISGETVMLLSKKYAAPPAQLADFNDVTYQEGLVPGSFFWIPVGNFNYRRVEEPGRSRPIAYKTVPGDKLRQVSRMFNVSQSTIQLWNKMETNELPVGVNLLVGWISYDASQTPFSSAIVKETPKVVEQNPVSPVVRSDDTDSSGHTGELEAEEPNSYRNIYEQQTLGVTPTEEAGAAVFYALKMRVKPGVFYAFHNTALKGSILKILNPASGKIIYAKVIGPIPKLNDYHNSIVALSNNAIAALGAKDKRMFCKIKHR